MAKCYSCPYKFDAQRKYGVVYHCMVTMGSLDITYYCDSLALTTVNTSFDIFRKEKT